MIFLLGCSKILPTSVPDANPDDRMMIWKIRKYLKQIERDDRIRCQNHSKNVARKEIDFIFFQFLVFEKF